jgi:hypothetical protein
MKSASCMLFLHVTSAHQGTKAGREVATTIVGMHICLTRIKDKRSTGRKYPTEGRGNGTQAKSTWGISATA